MVATYFANPFGPLQLKDKTDELLDRYFSNLYNHHIGVGELFTGLALPNGKDNPKLAAIELLELLNK